MKKYIVRLDKHWAGNVSVEQTKTNGNKAIKIITSDNDYVSKEVAINNIKQKLENVDFSIEEVFFKNKKVFSLGELEILLNLVN
ncbi:MAG: hypothetical protein WCH34_14080 [Bacteroidota bacterium]